MGVLLQAWYRKAQGFTVPSPFDKATPNVPWWWDHLAAQAQSFREAGFSALLLPPVLKTMSGAFPGADGYGCFDDYDAGSKNQYYSVPTRFGDMEQLRRLVAICRANNLDVYADNVMHQRMGGTGNGDYTYLAAQGTTEGRFPKSASCFVGTAPRVQRDPIAGPVADDFSFGDELAPLNGTFDGHHGYVMDNLIAAGNWLTRSVDFQGYRLDDTKGLAVEAVVRYLTSEAMAGKIGIGEYFDGNPQTLNWWVWNSGVNGRCYSFDFGFHFAVQAMCNNTSRYDMTQLDHVGLAGISPGQSVTFVENPDTDTDGYASVIWNKAQGYFFLLTTEGYPCVYYKDYAMEEGCYGLKPSIDTYIWIHEHLANGSTVFRHKEYQAVVYERLGSPGLLCGINNDQYNGWKTVTVPTSFGPNVHLHDYTGHSGDVWTDGNGWATIGIPPNVNGLGTVAYSRANIDQPNATGPAWVCRQSFYGADDLDIPAARLGANTVGQIWVAANTGLHVGFVGNHAGLTCEVQGPGGEAFPLANGHAHVQSPGAYTLVVVSTEPGVPFELSVAYTASKGFTPPRAVQAHKPGGESTVRSPMALAMQEKAMQAAEARAALRRRYRESAKEKA